MAKSYFHHVYTALICIEILMYSISNCETAKLILSKCFFVCMQSCSKSNEYNGAMGCECSVPHYIYISLTFWPWTRYIGQRKAIVKIFWAISKREYMAISTQMTSCVFLVEICLCVYFQICLSSKTEKISRELIVIINIYVMWN
jgi:hypothetical protein